MPLASHGYMPHTDTHRLYGRGVRFHTPAPSGLLPHINSIQPLAGTGQALLAPPPPACPAIPFLVQAAIEFAGTITTNLVENAHREVSSELSGQWLACTPKHRGLWPL